MLKVFAYKFVDKPCTIYYTKRNLFNYIYRLNNYDWIQDRSVEGENFDEIKTKELTAGSGLFLMQIFRNL